MRRLLGSGVALACLLVAGGASAATSTRSVPSAFGGNGHNASFDGRLYIVRTGPGWMVYVLRPEATTYTGDGMPDATGPLWSPALMIVNGEPNGENALAICEPDPARAPYACDAANNPSATGPFACYDVWLFDSDATRTVAQGGQTFRRRSMLLRVADPNTAAARPVAFQLGALEPLAAGAGVLHGIEPTFTRDGKLMVWNGSLNNGDQDSQMMYAVNATACGRTGWSAPRSLSHMVADPAVNTKYRLAMRQLRASDGAPYADGAKVFGAYPWLLPDGDGVIFAAANMPCRGMEDPPGCGPRRNATSVLGYPTNWALAHVDGGINPSTTDTVRLFFSSPGPTTFAQLPTSSGTDVWPFFGTNTSNYVELSFDDGLDGQYGGLWHMNEVVTAAGELDTSRSPDVSGYFNTAVVHGAITFPGPNNGVLGKAAIANGGWLEVAHDPSLEPINGITMDMTIRPAGNPDCDGQNNFRVLLRKGEAYSLVLEETRGVRARVRVADGSVRELYSGAEIAADGATWTRVSAEYDAPTGRFQIRFDDTVVAEETFAPAPLAGTGDALRIGGNGPASACPVGGNFAGTIDEVSVSRIARHIQTPPAEPDGADPGTDAGGGGGGGGGSGPGGGCCETGSGGGAAGAFALAGFVALALRRRRRA